MKRVLLTGMSGTGKSTVAAELAALATRTNNPFGKTPDELAHVLDNLDKVEPMLRNIATHEIVTVRPLDEVVEEIVELVGT
jgi:hypothetical protein